MNPNRTFMALVVAASLAGAVFAQERVVLDDEAIFVAVEEALDGARSLEWARIDVSNEIRVADRASRT